MDLLLSYLSAYLIVGFTVSTIELIKQYNLLKFYFTTITEKYKILRVLYGYGLNILLWFPQLLMRGVK